MQNNTKPVLIIGDLGSGVNIVKNLLLLSNNYRFETTNKDRLSELKKFYPIEFKFDKTNWINNEYKLRYWNKYYGIDLSDDINIPAILLKLKKINNVVFINHSAFYQKEEVVKLKEYFNLIYVCPKTKSGVKWQVNAYVDKITIKDLHNFTTRTDIEKAEIIKTKGRIYWQQLNFENFYHICLDRRTDFYCFCKQQKINTIALESLIKPLKHDMLYEQLVAILNYNAPKNNFMELITMWLNLHNE